VKTLKSFGAFGAFGTFGTFEVVRRVAKRAGGTFGTVLGVTLVVISGFAALAQDDVSDAELASASVGRTIALRTLATGEISTIPIEQYVARVLAGEGEPNAPEGATQALAIAIRTYATFNAGRHQADGHDLCDSTHCQVPRAANAATRRAAMATAGRILVYNGAPAEIFYSASCGGRTESAEQVWPKADLPYLRSVEDDVHEDDQPWTLEVSLRAAQQALARDGFTGSQLRNVEVDARSPSGRVTRLKLTGLRPDTISGEQFRTLIGARQFRSTAFDVDRVGTGLRFSGTGYGHGVGMCVIGAGRRARRGESATAILAKYYPGLDVVSLAAVGGRTSRGTAAAPAISNSVPANAGLPDAAPRASASPFVLRVPPSSTTLAADLEKAALAAYTSLSKTLGVSVAPVTISLHETLDGFRNATGRPWWVSAVSAGQAIDLVPAALLAQRDGLEMTLSVAMAELLVAPALTDRPAWVRVGAARYYSRAVPIAPPRARVQCPADAELLAAVSAVNQREAEARAEACFARALADRKDWRTVR
jgi:SpoIID/LytB domain protein